VRRTRSHEPRGAAWGSRPTTPRDLRNVPFSGESLETGYLLLRRQGWRAKYKRIEGLYREEGLSLRRGAGQRSDRVR
jgi:hypothetical protein